MGGGVGADSDLLVGLLALDALLGLPFPLQGVLPPPLSLLLPKSHQHQPISHINQTIDEPMTNESRRQLGWSEP